MLKRTEKITTVLMLLVVLFGCQVLAFSSNLPSDSESFSNASSEYDELESGARNQIQGQQGTVETSLDELAGGMMHSTGQEEQNNDELITRGPSNLLEEEPVRQQEVREVFRGFRCIGGTCEFFEDENGGSTRFINARYCFNCRVEIDVFEEHEHLRVFDISCLQGLCAYINDREAVEKSCTCCFFCSTDCD